MKRPCSLRTARTRAGFTQEQLGRLAQVRQSVISRLESGHVSEPRFTTVLSLARALQMSPEDLRFNEVRSL